MLRLSLLDVRRRRSVHSVVRISSADLGAAQVEPDAHQTSALWGGVLTRPRRQHIRDGPAGCLWVNPCHPPSLVCPWGQWGPVPVHGTVGTRPQSQNNKTCMYSMFCHIWFYFEKRLDFLPHILDACQVPQSCVVHPLNWNPQANDINKEQVLRRFAEALGVYGLLGGGSPSSSSFFHLSILLVPQFSDYRNIVVKSALFLKAGSVSSCSTVFGAPGTDFYELECLFYFQQLLAEKRCNLLFFASQLFMNLNNDGLRFSESHVSSQKKTGTIRWMNPDA